MDGKEYMTQVKELILESKAGILAYSIADVVHSRGKYFGDFLVKEIMERVKSAGYNEMLLDTRTSMKTAFYLYRKYGFTECDLYYNNPLDDEIYLQKNCNK